MTAVRVPMLDLKLEYRHMKGAVDAAIARCLEHQQWILGPEVRQLEDTIAAYLGVKHCVGTSSGTEALVLSLRALAIRRTGAEYFRREDLVITTPFTFTATGDAILRSGATPIFVDIDPATFNLDGARVRACAAERRGAVVGIVPVHLYGRACEMDEISAVAAQHGLFVVEDVAQAFGGHFLNRRLGSLGDAGAFSFFPSKILGGYGDGGMISTNDGDLADLCRMLLKHGGRDKYNVDHVGYNARLDTLQAAVLLAKFAYVDEFTARRRDIARSYRRELSGDESLSLPQDADGHVYHQFTVRVPGGERERTQRGLADAGVSSMVYYPVPLHQMKVFRGTNSVRHESLVHAEQAATEVLSLPIAPLLGREAIERVIAALQACRGSR